MPTLTIMDCFSSTRRRTFGGLSPGERLAEVDVLVIGYGAAGAAAALAAHDAGARVLVVEKCPQPGDNSLVSSANTVYPQRPDDVERFARYLTEVCDGTTPAEVIEAYVQGLLELPAWLESTRRDTGDPRPGVLGIDHRPVPGLYAAGELGSIWGFRYQTSTNFAEALAFGRIACHTAAS